jgi:hypothetical protein
MGSSGGKIVTPGAHARCRYFQNRMSLPDYKDAQPL